MVVTQQPFDIEVTIAVPGVRYTPDENVLQKAEQLVHEGLGLPDLKVVRAMRTPYKFGRPGLFKVEFENVEAKKAALAQSGRLRSWNVLGNKVFIRGSQSHDMRTQCQNWTTILKGEGLENEYMVNKNGRVLPRPGSRAAANILSSNQSAQGSQGNYGNQTYGTQASASQASYSQPPPSQASYSNNPLYGPPLQPPAAFGPRPRFGRPPNIPAPSYASVASQSNTGPPVANPLTQFMAGNI